MTLAFPKPRTIVAHGLRQSAVGEQCTLCLPGICLHSPMTVVLCHLPGGGRGVGMKGSDLHAVYGCFACHDVIDGRQNTTMTGAMLLDAMLRALSATHARMVEKGLLIVKGYEP